MDDETPELPSSLKLLKSLVMVLTVVMIVGVVTVVGLLVMRLGGDETPALPDQIALPGDARALAFTQGPDWYAVVTDGNEILIFDRLSGALRQSVAITP